MSANRSRPTVEIVDDGVAFAAWEVDGIGPIDLHVVDSLARMQLAVQQLGWSVRVRNPCTALRALIDLAGLDEVIALVSDGDVDTC